MDITKTRLVSSQTFGNPSGFLEAPVPQRSFTVNRSRTPDLDTRPTLIRSQTPVVMENQQEIAKMFSENMFADPAPQKAWKVGPKLFTDGHQRLIFMLREECGRMFSYNKRLKEQLTTLERAGRKQSEMIADLKSSLHGKAERLAMVTSELREAREIIRDMDDDLERSRSKRLSRINAHLDVPSLANSEYLAQ